MPLDSGAQLKPILSESVHSQSQQQWASHACCVRSQVHGAMSVLAATAKEPAACTPVARLVLEIASAATKQSIVRNILPSYLVDD